MDESKLVREDRAGFQTEGSLPSRVPSMALPESSGVIREMSGKFAAHPVTDIGSMTTHNRGASLNFRFVFGRKPFSACLPVAVEKGVEFAGEKHGLQSSMRPGSFAERSRLTFRDFARPMLRSPNLKLAYG